MIYNYFLNLGYHFAITTNFDSIKLAFACIVIIIAFMPYTLTLVKHINDITIASQDLICHIILLSITKVINSYLIIVAVDLFAVIGCGSLH